MNAKQCESCAQAAVHIDNVENLYRQYRDKAVHLIHQQFTANEYIIAENQMLKAELEAMQHHRLDAIARAEMMLRVAAGYAEMFPDFEIEYDETTCDGYCVAEDCRNSADDLQALAMQISSIHDQSDEDGA